MLRHLLIAIQKWVPVHFRFLREKIDNQLLKVASFFISVGPKLEFAFPIMLYRLGCILQQTLDLCIQCMTQLLGLLQKILCITFMYRTDLTEILVDHGENSMSVAAHHLHLQLKVPLHVTSLHWRCNVKKVVMFNDNDTAYTNQ